MGNKANSADTIVLAFAVLLEGAIAAIKGCGLIIKHDKTIKDSEIKQIWRNRLFIKRYWISPFANIDILSNGIMAVVKVNGGNDMPTALSKLLVWINGEEDFCHEIGPERCEKIMTDILEPALGNCRVLINGDIPEG